MEKSRKTVGIVMAVHNGETTVESTLESLNKQSKYYDYLLIVNDGSTDKTEEILERFKNHTNKLHIKNFKTSKGLASSYNYGIKKIKTNILVTMHQDIILKPNALRRLILPLQDNSELSNIVACSHIVDHPLAQWKKYNFWQKALFSRLLGKKFRGIDGKFDAFKTKILRDIGGFNSKTFRSAGEDGDLVYRLESLGVIKNTNAEIVHVHSMNPKFNVQNYIYKHAQYAEAQGVLLRLHGFRRGTVQSCKTFFRELLIMGLFVPYVNIFFLFLIIIYSILYTLPAITYREFDPRKVILPIVNILLLAVSTYYSTKGFITKKQTI